MARSERVVAAAGDKKKNKKMLRYVCKCEDKEEIPLRNALNFKAAP